LIAGKSSLPSVCAAAIGMVVGTNPRRFIKAKVKGTMDAIKTAKGVCFPVTLVGRSQRVVQPGACCSPRGRQRKARPRQKRRSLAMTVVPPLDTMPSSPRAQRGGKSLAGPFRVLTEATAVLVLLGR
jgi:hypothetical protein